MVNSPLHIAKRRSKDTPYYSPPPRKPSLGLPSILAQHSYQPLAEKDGDADWTSVCSSSRSSSASSAPMLKENAKGTQRTNYTFHRSKRQFNKYFTIILASTLVGFIVLLFVLSTRSARNVADRGKDRVRVWESFPLLKRYYGGIKMLVGRAENEVEYPIARGELARNPRIEVKNTWRPHVAVSDEEPHRRPIDIEASSCFLDEERQVPVPQLQAYDGVVDGFPNPIIGSHKVLSLDDSICFDKTGRYGPSTLR